jgi:hypothetical protein
VIANADGSDPRDIATEAFGSYGPPWSPTVRTRMVRIGPIDPYQRSQQGFIVVRAGAAVRGQAAPSRRFAKHGPPHPNHTRMRCLRDDRDVPDADELAQPRLVNELPIGIRGGCRSGGAARVSYVGGSTGPGPTSCGGRLLQALGDE